MHQCVQCYLPRPVYGRRLQCDPAIGLATIESHSYWISILCRISFYAMLYEIGQYPYYSRYFFIDVCTRGCVSKCVFVDVRNVYFDSCYVTGNVTLSLIARGIR